RVVRSGVAERARQTRRRSIGDERYKDLLGADVASGFWLLGSVGLDKHTGVCHGQQRGARRTRSTRSLVLLTICCKGRTLRTTHAGAARSTHRQEPSGEHQPFGFTRFADSSWSSPRACAAVIRIRFSFLTWLTQAMSITTGGIARGDPHQATRRPFCFEHLTTKLTTKPGKRWRER